VLPRLCVALLDLTSPFRSRTTCSSASHPPHAALHARALRPLLPTFCIPEASRCCAASFESAPPLFSSNRLASVSPLQPWTAARQILPCHCAALDASARLCQPPLACVWSRCCCRQTSRFSARRPFFEALHGQGLLRLFLTFCGLTSCCPFEALLSRDWECLFLTSCTQGPLCQRAAFPSQTCHRPRRILGIRAPRHLRGRMCDVASRC